MAFNELLINMCKNSIFLLFYRKKQNYEWIAKTGNQKPKEKRIFAENDKNTQILETFLALD